MTIKEAIEAVARDRAEENRTAVVRKLIRRGGQYTHMGQEERKDFMTRIAIPADVRAVNPSATLALTEQEAAAFQAMEEVATACQLAGDVGGRFAKTILMARAINKLRELINPQVMKEIMPLMNTRLGFKTDKDPNRKTKNRENGQWEAPQPYEVPVVKECVIEATLRGANLVGNEFNIISGQTYLTKEFFERVVGEIPGVTNVVVSPGVPRKEGDRAALIRVGVSWKKNGVPDQLKDAEAKPGRVLEIRTDAYSSTDQIIGKATRKALAAAYKQITGSDIDVPDGETTDFVDAQVVPQPNGHTQQDKEEGSNGSSLSSPSRPEDTQAVVADPPTTPETATTTRTTDPSPSSPASSAPAVDTESLAGQLADMVPDEFLKVLRDKAKDAGMAQKQPFEGGLFLYATKVCNVGDIKKIPVGKRLELYQAVIGRRFDFTKGTIGEAS